MPICAKEKPLKKINKSLLEGITYSNRRQRLNNVYIFVKHNNVLYTIIILSIKYLMDYRLE